MKEFLPAKCRCAALREAFGEKAARCGPCLLNARHEDLRARGFVIIDRKHMLPFQDLGIDTETVLETRMVWAPEWAKRLHGALFDASFLGLGPVLQRAAADIEFRQALETVLALNSDSTRLCAALVTLADGAGVWIPTTDAEWADWGQQFAAR